MYGILGRYDYPVKKIKRNADRKQSAKTHQGYGVFWQADVFSRREPLKLNISMVIFFTYKRVISDANL